MKIVIIGAGISGLASYLSLKKHLPRPSTPAADHVYTIYEAYDTDKDSTFEQRLSSSRTEANLPTSTLIVGGGLGIAPNGVNVLRRLDSDLLKDIVTGGYVISKYNLKSKHGTLLMGLDPQVPAYDDADNENEGDRKMIHTVATSRHSLWRCLRTRVPDGIISKKRISQVIAGSNGGPVTVRFEDGSMPVEADMVIGADGLRSTTKNALFPDIKGDIYPPHYEGLVGIGGFVTAPPHIREKAGKGTMSFVFGGNGFFGYFPAASSPSSHRDSVSHVSEPSNQLGWWSTYAMEECPTDLRNVNGEEIIKDLRARYRHWSDPVIQQIISDEELNIKHIYPTWTAPEIPTWERDGVVLVGDAAHALPSTSGQGSSQALEDAEAFTLFLSHELRNMYQNPLESQAATERKAVTTAAKRYVELRKPHVKKIFDRARSMQNRKKDMSIFEEYFMYAFMWIMGWFPSVMSKPQQEVASYNVRKEVERVLEQS
ncbi:extracellular salicylate hydroxylase/monooxygenase, putative [Talaromyces stipitatus ATCC 10500]|uniref:Extracellular salicylate hydroxylase/monooxygenase, putative n=1 Tax=Talaromyces stipitatus (strain ATCC 10500 / CBS 375.48 / QM 6759 / NRRL 1006) TaxID=441959 RepID=B8MC40_TALSN|nr:extracellular salicylate hydroxylase/monooxygenase, putative [Talaromyces stipitatus ATCC 10500]EED18486.1 extracellular salicylate hydroxylase/monooxygenase, putative [Talaromyces stipitatus ATCC 10500]